MSILLLSYVVLALGAPGADWLVTRDGERIETRGPWQVEGGRVIYRLPNGNLSSLRTTAVDLEESRRATSAAAAGSAPAESDPAGRNSSRDSLPAEPVLVLTADDVSSAPPEAPSASRDDEPETAGRGLRVIEWQDVTSGGDAGVRLRGRLADGERDAVGGVEVEVTLFDDGGLPLASAPAEVAAERRGWPRTFEALLEGVHVYDRVEFEVTRPAESSPTRSRLSDPKRATEAFPQPRSEPQPPGATDGAPSDAGPRAPSSPEPSSNVSPSSQPDPAAARGAG